MLVLILVPGSFVAPMAFAQTPSPPPTPSPTAAPGNVTELSAQRAAEERAKIYRAGKSYSLWLDSQATRSGRPFLTRPVFDHVTWMRLLASIAALLLVGGISALLLWFIQKRAGRIESSEHQSWLALAAAAVRKPLALIAALYGSFFALVPLVLGIADRPTRLFWGHALTTVVYAGRVIAILWLIFQFIRAVEKRMRHWAQRTGNALNIVVVPIIGQALRLIVPLLAIILLLPLLHLPGGSTWLVQKSLGILLIAGLCILIMRGTLAVQNGLMAGHRLDVADNLAARQMYTRVTVIRKIIITAVVIIGGGSILMMFGPVRQFGTSILASAGIAGIILGFAAQKTLGNFLAGIQIALTQPMLIDDVVVLEGEFGRIEEITLTYVVVRTWDLRRLVLPITYFIEKPFQNWSRRSTEVLGAVYLYLDYQVPLGELRKQVKRLVEENPNWDKKVCGLQVTDTKENTIEVRALVSASDAGKCFDLRCQVREGLVEFLRSEYPESLPRVRAAFERLDEKHRPVETSGRSVAGKQHERGSAAPGLKKNEEQSSDGENGRD
jgi:small-conductance mechanosensitive channel